MSRLYDYESYDGVTDLTFVRHQQETLLSQRFRSGNSRLSSRMETADDVPYYFLVSTGGGFTEGESYYNRAILKEGSHAILTSQTPNYIYKCQNGRLTKQKNDLFLRENAFLEYYLDEIIPYHDAYYQQDTVVHMEEGSKLILTDGLTSGWSPQDKPFSYRQISMKTQIYLKDQLIYNDHLLAVPKEEDMNELGFFEGYSNFNSALIIDTDFDVSWLDAFREHLSHLTTDGRFGLSSLQQSGLVLRILGHSSDANREVLWAFIHFYREQIQAYNHLHLRKGY